MKGRPHKEISKKNLAAIIQARMEEILAFVLYEIKNSGFEKKLAAGIVLTGGGSQLKHLPQLVEYFTGMDCRIGTPNEHLSKTVEDVANPMFATGVGLIMKGLNKLEYELAANNTQEINSDITKSNNKKKEKTVTHSSNKKGNIFGHISSKVAEWLRDDIE